MDFIEPLQIMRFIAALVFVMGLMGGLALVLKRINEKHSISRIAAKRRLKILETLPIDARRKLVLIRRDDQEHLIILGGNNETLIESNIESTHDEIHDRDTKTKKAAKKKAA